MNIAGFLAERKAYNNTYKNEITKLAQVKAIVDARQKYENEHNITVKNQEENEYDITRNKSTYSVIL